MPVLLSGRPLELCARNYTLDYVLRVDVEVGSGVEEARHDLIFFIKQQLYLLKICFSDVLDAADARPPRLHLRNLLVYLS